MMALEQVLATVGRVNRHDLTVWIERRWVRPHHEAGGYVFTELDVARVTLDLRGEGASPRGPRRRSGAGHGSCARNAAALNGAARREPPARGDSTVRGDSGSDRSTDRTVICPMTLWL